MTTTTKQQAALGRIMETDGGVKHTRLLPSGALVVIYEDGTRAVIERDGKVTK